MKHKSQLFSIPGVVLQSEVVLATSVCQDITASLTAINADARPLELANPSAIQQQQLANARR